MCYDPEQNQPGPTRERGTAERDESMSDLAGQESTSEQYTEAPAAPEAAPQAEDHSTGTQNESNPFWGEIEKITGPNVYKTIQPHLAKADTAARQRIEAVNQSFAPWKELVDQGIKPEQVRQAIGVVQQLNTNPEQVFTSLQEFLQREGRLPSQAELKNEVAEDIEDAENGGQPDPRDRQIQELQQRLEQLDGFVNERFTAQQQQEMQQEADTWADSEWRRIEQAHPDLTKEDFADIGQLLLAQTNRGEAPDLDRAVATYATMRDRIRTTPRAGAAAPRLPMGPGGGSPQQQANPVSLSKEDRIAAATAVLSRGRS